VGGPEVFMSVEEIRFGKASANDIFIYGPVARLLGCANQESP